MEFAPCALSPASYPTATLACPCALLPDRNPTATAANADYTGYKLALTKAFSNRTTGYVAYVSTDKEVATQADSSTYVVGVRHSF